MAKAINDIVLALREENGVLRQKVELLEQQVAIESGLKYAAYARVKELSTPPKKKKS